MPFEGLDLLVFDGFALSYFRLGGNGCRVCMGGVLRFSGYDVERLWHWSYWADERDDFLMDRVWLELVYYRKCAVQRMPGL